MLDLLGLKKSVGALAAQARELKSNIEQLKREREDIATAPAAISDIKQAIAVEIQARSGRYAENLRGFMDQFSRKASRLQDPAAFKTFALIAVTPDQSHTASMLTLEAGLAALMGDALLKGLYAQIDAMNWPSHGLPMSERDKRLRELDGDIAKLEQKFNNLLDGARTSGITIDV